MSSIFRFYLDKFSSRAKAEKMAKEVEKDFPGVKVI